MDRSLPRSLQEVPGTLPRGVVGQQQQQQQQQQQHAQHEGPQHAQAGQQQQQQHRQPGVRLPAVQSLRDKNLSFSGALRRLQTLADMLELLHNPNWGPALSDLDGVSVVGALVWVMKSAEWQRLQQQGSEGQQEWQVQDSMQAYIEMLLDRAEVLVLPEHNFSMSSSHSATSSRSRGGTHSAAAPAAPAAAPLMRPAELANLIYVTSKLQQQRPRLLAAAAAALTLDLYACSTNELSRLIWGLAAARIHPGDAWLLAFSKADQAHFADADAGQLATSVYGLARLGHRPPDVWIASWLEASLPLMGSGAFAARHLAIAAWGLALFRFRAPPGWLSAFYAASAAAMPQLVPRGVCQLCQALVVLGGGRPPPEAWTRQLVATARPMFRDMELLHLCNVGWALANWGHRPAPEVVTEWLDASLPLLPAATPVDLAVLLWACHKLSFIPHQRWLEAWFASAAAALPRCEPLQLTTIAVALGGWGLVPVPGFSIDFWRASKSRFPSFTPYQLSLLVMGLGRARRSVPHTWACALLAAFANEQLEEAEPGDVCRLIGGLGSVAVKPRGSRAWVTGSAAVRGQLQRCVAWLLPQLGAVAPSWLVLLVRGLVRLGCPLQLQQVQALNDAATAMDEGLAPHHRLALVHGFQQLRALASDGASNGDAGTQ